VAGLEGLDLLVEPEEVSELIDALEEAALGEGIDLEGHLRSVGPGDRLIGEVDLHPGGAIGLDVAHELRVDRALELDREQAALERVVLEDVGKARGEDRAEAPARERPRRVLTRGAAAEVVARDKDLGALARRLVEDELRVGRAVLEVAPVEE